MWVASNGYQRNLGVFKLIMITVISVDSIRNLPISAQYGFTLVSFYVLAGLTFFLPLILVTSRLASDYPNTGGSYVWIEAAFGKKTGFVSIWLQWVYQLIWYPTIFAFICTTIAALVHPIWENDSWFILVLSLVLFWLMTFMSTFGIRTAGWVSTVGAIFGTLLPMLFIIVLAIYWLASGHASAVAMTWQGLIPNQGVLLNLGFFANILFSLLGLDVAAMHAGDVKNPKSSYPIAMSVAGVLILLSLVLSSLALCVVIAPAKIGLLSGLMEGFALFLSAYHLSWLMPLIGASIILGGVGIAFSWMIGLARGLQVACVASNISKPLQKLNQHNMPSGVLLVQALIFSALITVFLMFPNVNSSYWVLSALTSQFALAYYVLLFAAAIKLRRGLELQISLFRNVGRVFSAILAILTSIFGILVGFYPPSSIEGSGIFRYELILIAGIILFCAPLWFVFKHMAKNSQV